ncbi:MAG: heavy-metal-associated domain-containing protein [Imperialibacter sp.]|uniref:heavy-metal-associated domain-containing protein n=1 Tax=Imperialibacter sp. TaxID=2038411 RepID=UPI0032EC00A6
MLHWLLCWQGTAQSTESQKTAKIGQKSETVKLKVTGLTCVGCASLLYKVLKETKGVIDNSVEYPGDIAVVDYDPKQTQPEKLIAAIEEKTSYKAELLKPNNDE